MPRRITIKDNESLYADVIITDIRSYAKTFLHRLNSAGRNKANRLMINGTNLSWKIESIEVTCYITEVQKLTLEGLKTRQDTRIGSLLQKTAGIQFIDEYERLPFSATLARSIVAGSQISDIKGNVSGYPIYNVFLDIPSNAANYIGMNTVTKEEYFEFKFKVSEE